MASFNGRECVVPCDSCQKDYKLGPANSRVFNFTDVGIIFVESACHCGEEADNFITEDIMQFLGKRGVEVTECVNPPVALVNAWQQLHPDEWEPVEPYDLSPRHEKAIEALRWELEGVITPQDILDVDIENRLPKRWD